MLKKSFVCSLVFVFCLLNGQIATFAQKAKLYDQPNRLALNGRAEPDPDEANKPPHQVWITEKFYPIGFSKDGKFAFYTEPADEACGCYFARLVIQDLRTDKILWEHNYDGGPREFPPDGNATEDQAILERLFKSHWKKNQKLFSGKLAQYGIVADKSFQLLTSSIDFNKDIFTPKLELNFSPDDDGYHEIDGESYYGKKGSVVLRMISKANGEKIVYEKKYNPKDGNIYRDAELSGFLKSPFEPRIALILVEILRGYEGPPHITKIKIIGADLTKGFS